MKNGVKVALRMSEVRQRLNEIAGLEGDDLTDEVRSESDKLHSEYTDLEVRSRAALVGESTETVTEGAPVDPERAELEDRATLSGILSGIMSGRGTSGAERELQDELHLDGDQVPLSLLGSKTEHRTTGWTPAPADVGVTSRPIVPAVFPRSASAYLGVRMPTVPVGEALFTVLTTNLAPDTPDAGDEQAHSAGAFTPTTLTPHRIQGSFFIRREDRASLAGMESALRMNLSDAMQSKLDSEVIAGTEGFLGSDGLTARTGDAASTATFGVYRKLVFDSDTVDGQYSYQASDIKLLVGPHTYAHAAGVYRGNNDNVDALAALVRDSGGVQVSAHIPDPATNDQAVIVAKDVGREHAVAPIWEGVQVIVDEVTQAKSGEIVFTAVMLWGRLSILRSDGFVRRTVQVA